jgi:hypothetical protein
MDFRDVFIDESKWLNLFDLKYGNACFGAKVFEKGG